MSSVSDAVVMLLVLVTAHIFHKEGVEGFKNARQRKRSENARNLSKLYFLVWFWSGSGIQLLALAPGTDSEPRAKSETGIILPDYTLDYALDITAELSPEPEAAQRAAWRDSPIL